MKALVRISIMIAIIIGHAYAQKPDPNKEEWIPLFNGKDLRDWVIKITGHAQDDNYKNTFIVDSGILKVNYAEYETFGTNYGHIYYKQPFSYYKLRVVYRFVGKQVPGGANWNVRNSGVMMHSQSPQTLTFNQAFPVSLEMQFLGGLGDGKPRTTANLCTPGTMIEMDGKLNTNHCINSSSKTYEGDQWVFAEAIVLGDSLIQHLVDGKVVLTYSKPRVGETAGATRDYMLDKYGKENEGMILKEGYIALQAESHAIHFSKVELLNLKGCMNPKCTEYKSYHVAKGECKCDKQ